MGWGGVIWSLGQFVGCVIVGGGVEILLITNKSLFVASSWSHLYLLNLTSFSLPNAITSTSQTNTCQSFILFGSQLNSTF